MQQPVSGIHIAHGLMHGCSLDFEQGGGLNRKTHAMTSSEFLKSETFYGTKNERSKAKSLGYDLVRNLDLL